MIFLSAIATEINWWWSSFDRFLISEVPSTIYFFGRNWVLIEFFPVPSAVALYLKNADFSIFNSVNISTLVHTNKLHINFHHHRCIIKYFWILRGRGGSRGDGIFRNLDHSTNVVPRYIDSYEKATYIIISLHHRSIIRYFRIRGLSEEVTVFF